MVHDLLGALRQGGGDALPSVDFPMVRQMTGFDSSDGYRIAPMDSEEARIGNDERHENRREGYEINPILSCSNTDFGGDDPATEGPEPKPEMAPAWYHEDRDDTPAQYPTEVAQ